MTNRYFPPYYSILKREIVGGDGNSTDAAIRIMFGLDAQMKNVIQALIAYRRAMYVFLSKQESHKNLVDEELFSLIDRAARFFFRKNRVLNLSTHAKEEDFPELFKEAEDVDIDFPRTAMRSILVKAKKKKIDKENNYGR